MIKKLLAFAFGLIYSMVAFADFSGQTVLVEYMQDTNVLGSVGIDAPGSGVIDAGGGNSCNFDITATEITIGCTFSVFGNPGGITFHGFRFTQQGASPPAITGVTPQGTVENANTILVNLYDQAAPQETPLVLTVTFAAPVAPGAPVAPHAQSVPALTPLGLGLLGLLIAVVGYRAQRRR